VYGYVTKDEFDARVNQTFVSRTYAELALVTADLPTGLTTAPAQATGQCTGSRERQVGRPRDGDGSQFRVHCIDSRHLRCQPGGAVATDRQRLRGLVPRGNPDARLAAGHALWRSAANAAGRTAGSVLTLILPGVAYSLGLLKTAASPTALAAWVAVVRFGSSWTNVVDRSSFPQRDRRMLRVLVIQPMQDTCHRLRWSAWRRRHQHRAKTSHYQRQASQP
jgi:uncharacterized protein DUF1707